MKRMLVVFIVGILFFIYLFGVLEYVACGFCIEGMAHVRLKLMGCFSGDYIEVERDGFRAFTVPCGESRMIAEFSEEPVKLSGVVVVDGAGRFMFARRVTGTVERGLDFAVAEGPMRVKCGEEINQSLFNFSGKVNCSISFPYRK